MPGALLKVKSANASALSPDSPYADFLKSIDCDSTSPGDQDYVLRIVALFVILGVSAIGGVFPWICRAFRMGEQCWPIELLRGSMSH